MCDVCGCGDPKLVRVDAHVSLLSSNADAAAHNRDHFARAKILVLNLMGSPGSGKTLLLESTARRIAGRRSLAALSGDLATDLDARRLSAAGVRSRAITTGSACHLDAEMVHHGLHQLGPEPFEILFVENVGNLVCPAIYDLGQRANVVVLSVTEGEDKPLKYPIMFRHADLVVLNKIDLLPHLDVRTSAIEEALSRVMPAPRLLPVSARTGEGLERWIAWLDELSRGEP